MKKNGFFNLVLVTSFLLSNLGAMPTNQTAYNPPVNSWNIKTLSGKISSWLDGLQVVSFETEKMIETQALPTSTPGIGPEPTDTPTPGIVPTEWGKSTATASPTPTETPWITETPDIDEPSETPALTPTDIITATASPCLVRMSSPSR